MSGRQYLRAAKCSKSLYSYTKRQSLQCIVKPTTWIIMNYNKLEIRIRKTLSQFWPMSKNILVRERQFYTWAEIAQTLFCFLIKFLIDGSSSRFYDFVKCGACLLSGKSVWIWSGTLSSLGCSCAESVILFYLIGLQQLWPRFIIFNTHRQKVMRSHGSSSARAHTPLHHQVFLLFFLIFRSNLQKIIIQIISNDCDLRKRSLWKIIDCENCVGSYTPPPPKLPQHSLSRSLYYGRVRCKNRNHSRANSKVLKMSSPLDGLFMLFAFTVVDSWKWKLLSHREHPFVQKFAYFLLCSVGNQN